MARSVTRHTHTHSNIMNKDKYVEELYAQQQRHLEANFDPFEQAVILAVDNKICTLFMQIPRRCTREVLRRLVEASQVI